MVSEKRVVVEAPKVMAEMEETRAKNHTSELLLPTNPLAFYLTHKGEIDAAIAKVLNGGWYILGKEADAFDQEFAQYLAVQYAVGVAIVVAQMPFI